VRKEYDFSMGKRGAIDTSCCKCGRVTEKKYLLGGPFRKWIHCEECYKIIVGVENGLYKV